MLDINLFPLQYQKKGANGYNPNFAPIVFTGVVLFCLSSYGVNNLKIDYINSTSKDLKTRNESITNQVATVTNSESQIRVIQTKFNQAISKWGNPNALYPKMDMISSSMGNDIWIDKLVYSDQVISVGQAAQPANGQTTGQAAQPVNGQTTGQTTQPANGQTTGQTTQPANSQTTGQATQPANSQTTGQVTQPANSQTGAVQATGNNFVLHGYSFSYKSIAELMKNMKALSGLEAKIISMDEKKFENKVEYIEFQLSFTPKGSNITNGGQAGQTQQGGQVQNSQIPANTTQQNATDSNLPVGKSTTGGGN